jgi:hypothetical protein
LLESNGDHGIEIKSRLRLLAGLKWTQKVIARAKWRLPEINRVKDSTRILLLAGLKWTQKVIRRTKGEVSRVSNKEAGKPDENAISEVKCMVLVFEATKSHQTGT